MLVEWTPAISAEVMNLTIRKKELVEILNNIEVELHFFEEDAQAGIFGEDLKDTKFLDITARIEYLQNRLSPFLSDSQLNFPLTE